MRRIRAAEVHVARLKRKTYGRLIIAFLPVLALLVTLALPPNGKTALAASKERAEVSKKSGGCSQILAKRSQGMRSLRSMYPHIPPPPPPVLVRRVVFFMYEGGSSEATCNGTGCEPNVLTCETPTTSAVLGQGGCCVKCCWDAAPNICSSCTNCTPKLD